MASHASEMHAAAVLLKRAPVQILKMAGFGLATAEGLAARQGSSAAADDVKQVHAM